MAKIGLQLYSIKEISAKSLFDAIKLASDSGYDGVEFAGFFETPSAELKKYMDSIGMLPCGSHTGINILENDLNKTMEYNLEIGNDFIVVPSLPEEMRNSREAWLETAETFNRMNEKITANGLKLGYHNHAFEFEMFEGEYGYDIFAGNTSDDIILEIDTYWVEHPGLSSIEYVKKYKNRIELLHVKDIADDMRNTEIGNGNIDFIGITEIAVDTDWFIVEQENFDIPQEESIKKSCSYLKGILK